MRKKKKKKVLAGSTEIRTRILGFRVPGANRYTIEPVHTTHAKLKPFIMT